MENNNSSSNKVYAYDKDKILLALSLLGSIQVTGLKSCENVLKINSILSSPTKIEGEN